MAARCVSALHLPGNLLSMVLHSTGTSGGVEVFRALVCTALEWTGLQFLVRNFLSLLLF